MDPYLEAYWGDVHTSLTLYARDILNPHLPKDLVARVEEYLALETDEVDAPRGYYPDVRVTQEGNEGDGGTATAVAAPPLTTAEPVEVPLYEEPPTLRDIRIFDRETGNRVITVIEFLSLANKVGTAGRRAYRRKQRDFHHAGVNVVEIDLLRDGEYVLIPMEHYLPQDCRGPYRVSVVRRGRVSAQVYRVPLRGRLPEIRIPLRPADTDVVLDLQMLLDRGYENGRYDTTIDYRAAPQPPLQGDDAIWADELLREKGLRKDIRNSSRTD